MRRYKSVPSMFILAAFGSFLSVGQSWGQSVPPPRLLYVMPPGGQAGSSFEILLTGQDIDTAESLHFNFPGVTAERLGSEKAPAPMDPKLKKQPAKMQAGLLSQKFKMTLPANAPLGIQDVRIVTKGGVSNP